MTIEKKYCFDNRLHRSVLTLASRLLKEDSDFPDSTVTSIYFDTDDDMLLGQKVNSEYLKTKIRLRWYDRTPESSDDNATVYLEKKTKRGILRDKSRRLLPASDPHVANWLSGGEKPIPGELLSGWPGADTNSWKPRLAVRYSRRRFSTRDGKTRVNVDWNITTWPIGRPLSVPKTRLTLGRGVIEVKDPSFAVDDHVATVIRTAAATREAFSKYLECYLNTQASRRR